MLPCFRLISGPCSAGLHALLCSTCHALPTYTTNVIISKHAVETIETFDFLREIVEAVPDPSAGGTIDLEAEASAEGKKKRRSKKVAVPGVAEGEGGAVPKRRRKKKKADTEEENGQGIVPGTSDKGKTGSERVMDQDAEMYDPEDDPEEEENATLRRMSPDDDDDD